MIKLKSLRNPNRTGAAVFALLLLAAPVYRADSPAEPRYPALPNFHRVNANLYRGAQPKPGGVRQLHALKIKTIINLRGADDETRAEEREAHALGMKFFNLPLPGNSRPSAARVEEILALVEDAENFPVFVHCKHGADRTGTIIACYRIAKEHVSYAEARAEAKRYGLHWTQWGMKDFIKDFARDHAAPAVSPAKSASLRRLRPHVNPDTI
jgi:protein tyrosine phosphatase (PTP) superfamily phosphohydrolase (DUF442 family)